jgi:exopolyphosphatase/guanosine-5'-triphosphate,3'-diphosphate pyrophosphatase
MSPTRRRTLRPSAEPPPATPPDADSARPVAVLDLGASAIRLVVAELPPGEPVRIVEQASRGVLLGKDTFTHGRLGSATIEATLKVLEGFRRIMDTYGVVRYRAVATSAVREAANRDSFLDRLRLKTGIEVEVIDGSEENRLTYSAIRDRLRGHEALSVDATLLVEVGGGSADISFLRRGEPHLSGAYALGAIRLRQSLASFHGSHEQRIRLLRRHIHNVVEDIRREMPLREARQVIALGGDVRFAAERVLGETASSEAVPSLGRDAFIAFCDQMTAEDEDLLVERYGLPQVDAETLVPALLTYRELVLETPAETVTVPDVTMRDGLLLEFTRPEGGDAVAEMGRQVLASALGLGEKYRIDAAHARNVAFLATRLFDELRKEHGLGSRHRLLLEVAALLHDIGIFLGLRAHHKHSQYILSISEVFGLTQDDMLVVSNIARYHRRGLPQRSHVPFMALDRDTRTDVTKLAAILRLANALDADHLQKVKDLRVVAEGDGWVVEVEGAGDLTMERLASLARADLLTEVFGRRLSFREGGARP